MRELGTTYSLLSENIVRIFIIQLNRYSKFFIKFLYNNKYKCYQLEAGGKCGMGQLIRQAVV